MDQSRSLKFEPWFLWLCIVDVNTQDKQMFKKKTLHIPSNGTRLFGLAVSVWAIRSRDISVDYETLQKSYINGKTSSLIESALPPSSYWRLPKFEAFHSKRTPFTIRNSVEVFYSAQSS